MHQEPSDELFRGQAHPLLPVTRLDTVVLPSERHGVCIGTDEALVRDRRPMSRAVEIVQHLLGFARRSEVPGKGISVHPPSQITEESKLDARINPQLAEPDLP